MACLHGAAPALQQRKRIVIAAGPVQNLTAVDAPPRLAEGIIHARRQISRHRHQRGGLGVAIDHCQHVGKIGTGEQAHIGEAVFCHC